MAFYMCVYKSHRTFFLLIRGRFLFEELLRGRGSRSSSHACKSSSYVVNNKLIIIPEDHHSHPRMGHPFMYGNPFREAQESEAARQERLRQARQRQDENEARRVREAAHRKAQQQLERDLG
jgi:hypothetical protein